MDEAGCIAVAKPTRDVCTCAVSWNEYLSFFSSYPIEHLHPFTTLATLCGAQHRIHATHPTSPTTDCSTCALSPASEAAGGTYTAVLDISQHEATAASLDGEGGERGRSSGASPNIIGPNTSFMHLITMAV